MATVPKLKLPPGKGGPPPKPGASPRAKSGGKAMPKSPRPASKSKSPSPRSSKGSPAKGPPAKGPPAKGPPAKGAAAKPPSSPRPSPGKSKGAPTVPFGKGKSLTTGKSKGPPKAKGPSSSKSQPLKGKGKGGKSLPLKGKGKGKVKGKPSPGPGSEEPADAAPNAAAKPRRTSLVLGPPEKLPWEETPHFDWDDDSLPWASKLAEEDADANQGRRRSSVSFYTGLEHPYASFRLEGLSITNVSQQAEVRLARAIRTAVARVVAVSERFVEIKLRADGNATRVVAEIFAPQAAEEGVLMGVSPSADPEISVILVEERLEKQHASGALAIRVFSAVSMTPEVEPGRSGPLDVVVRSVSTFGQELKEHRESEEAAEEHYQADAYRDEDEESEVDSISGRIAFVWDPERRLERYCYSQDEAVKFTQAWEPIECNDDNWERYLTSEPANAEGVDAAGLTIGGVGNFLDFTGNGKKKGSNKKGDASDSEAEDLDRQEDEGDRLERSPTNALMSGGASKSPAGGMNAHRSQNMGASQTAETAASPNTNPGKSVKTLTDDTGLEGLMLREAALKQALRTIPTFKIPEVPRFYDQELFEAKSVYDDLRRTQPTREDLIARQIQEEEQRRQLDYVAPRMLPPAPSNLDFEDVWRKVGVVPRATPTSMAPMGSGIEDTRDGARLWL
eukprot:gnl/MRDRNA2_/MRDRNA2_99042_c0_seq1.p1 gnl/MRDRNA2_/MRDRNA2_99042_c0~~gnl/MRDRNA2_/MRDRNA2_99042_c0_seq1.p1  ORF type:complete len:676 (-),score=147.68 gnl/MRDRNA2_/MRDRNA2_99042_c0_seq1:139-2166(-)